MSETIVEMLSRLPPLWSTEARDTAEIVLPLRFTCRWHRLTWYPVERSGHTLFGLTLRTVPEWRHFDQSELTGAHHSRSVHLDWTHVARTVPQVPEVRLHDLADLSTFAPIAPEVV